MRYREFQAQQLNEVKMSLNYLRSEVAKIDARAGMEFEMVVPGVGDVEPEYEPDYNYDRQVESIDDIISFFSGEDDWDAAYTANSERYLDRLRRDLMDEYWDWAEEKKQESWNEDAEEHIREYLMNNREWVDEQLMELLDRPMFPGEASKILAIGKNAPVFDSSRELKDYTDRHPEYKLYQEAMDQVERRAEGAAQEAAADGGDLYDAAFEQWSDNYSYENDAPESDFLDFRGLDYMGQVESRYEIYWPYHSPTSNSDVDVHQVASDFEDAVGRPTKASETYHGGVRTATAYVVEPDSSIQGDEGNDGGLEFVSPPLPIAEMLDDLKKVVEWANDYGCYTNKSTGLHMNVSVPGYSMDKLDYIKLALFIGDEYVLSQFGREANSYCKSAVTTIENLAAPEQVAEVMKRMRQHMNVMASKIIHSGVTSKYTSINTKDGYVEFRSPGGNWLEYDLEKLEHTLLRFVYGLSIAIDENAHRQEYAKKLYKLISPSDTPMTNTLQYFARFSSGELPVSALKSFVKQAQAIRNMGKPKPAAAVAGQPGPGQFTGNWLIRNASGQILQRFGGVGNSQADANRYAIRWLANNGYGSGTEVEVVPEMA